MTTYEFIVSEQKRLRDKEAAKVAAATARREAAAARQQQRDNTSSTNNNSSSNQQRTIPVQSSPAPSPASRNGYEPVQQRNVPENGDIEMANGSSPPIHPPAADGVDEDEVYDPASEYHSRQASNNNETAMVANGDGETQNESL